MFVEELNDERCVILQLVTKNNEYVLGYRGFLNEKVNDSELKKLIELQKVVNVQWPNCPISSAKETTRKAKDVGTEILPVRVRAFGGWGKMKQSLGYLKKYGKTTPERRDRQSQSRKQFPDYVTSISKNKLNTKKPVQNKKSVSKRRSDLVLLENINKKARPSSKSQDESPIDHNNGSLSDYLGKGGGGDEQGKEQQEESDKWRFHPRGRLPSTRRSPSHSPSGHPKNVGSPSQLLLFPFCSSPILPNALNSLRSPSPMRYRTKAGPRPLLSSTVPSPSQKSVPPREDSRRPPSPIRRRSPAHPRQSPSLPGSPTPAESPSSTRRRLSRSDRQSLPRYQTQDTERSLSRERRRSPAHPRQSPSLPGSPTPVESPSSTRRRLSGRRGQSFAPSQTRNTGRSPSRERSRSSGRFQRSSSPADSYKSVESPSSTRHRLSGSDRQSLPRYQTQDTERSLSRERRRSPAHPRQSPSLPGSPTPLESPSSTRRRLSGRRGQSFAPSQTRNTGRSHSRERSRSSGRFQRSSSPADSYKSAESPSLTTQRLSGRRRQSLSPPEPPGNEEFLPRDRQQSPRGRQPSAPPTSRPQRSQFATRRPLAGNNQQTRPTQFPKEHVAGGIFVETYRINQWFRKGTKNLTIKLAKHVFEDKDLRKCTLSGRKFRASDERPRKGRLPEQIFKEFQEFVRSKNRSDAKSRKDTDDLFRSGITDACHNAHKRWMASQKKKSTGHTEERGR